MDKDEWLFALEVFGFPILAIIIAFVVFNAFWSALCVVLAVAWLVYESMKFGPEF